jgi:hypothetical protein
MAAPLNCLRGFVITQAEARLDFEVLVGLGASDARES